MAKPKEPAKLAYTADEFCAIYRMSRTKLWRLWRKNKGPKAKRFGGRKIIILVEDAEAWARSDGARAA